MAPIQTGNDGGLPSNGSPPGTETSGDQVIAAQNAELRMTLQITRKATGITETVELICTTVE
jgi:hypothetical protein